MTYRATEDFWGQNAETPPYPSAWTFRRLDGLYRVLRDILGIRLSSCLLASGHPPFMVELFAAKDLPWSPSLVIGPVSPVTRKKTPHASRRYAVSCENLTPWIGFKLQGFMP